MVQTSSQATEKIDALRGFEPFSSVSDDQLLILASKSEIATERKNFRLFEHGDNDDWIICLLDGKVKLTAKDGAAKIVEAGTDPAARPLAQLKPRQYTATAQTPIRFLRIDTSTLGNLQGNMTAVNYDIKEFEVEDAEMNSEVLWKQHSDLLEGKLSLPSLPQVAMKVCELIDKESTDIDAVAKTILADPAITAKLVRAANSPLYRGHSQVENIEQAIVRLGLKTTRQLVSSFAMKELFRAESKLIQDRMTAVWQHSTEVAATCYVVAEKTKQLDREQALLAGLLHDIGILPLLIYAQSEHEMASAPEVLNAFLEASRAQVGAMILKSWNFPASFVTAAEVADDWLRESQAAPDYGDIVIVSQLHTYIGTAAMPDIPPMDKLPAFQRLAGDGLDPALSVDIMREAKQEIEQVRMLFRS